MAQRADANPLESLEGLVSRWREEASGLRSCGADGPAAALERCAGDLDLSLTVTRSGLMPRKRDGEKARTASETPEEDRMLRVGEAAEILGVKDRWLYDRSDSLPFARKLAPRTLRFSERGLHRWLETRP